MSSKKSTKKAQVGDIVLYWAEGYPMGSYELKAWPAVVVDNQDPEMIQLAVFKPNPMLDQHTAYCSETPRHGFWTWRKANGETKITERYQPEKGKGDS
jgi:hypothetical protein